MIQVVVPVVVAQDLTYWLQWRCVSKTMRCAERSTSIDKEVANIL